MPFRALLDNLIDMVLPVACAGCDVPGRPMCAACTSVLAGPARPVEPRPAPPGFPPCWAVAAYGGPARSALLAYKERGRADLLRPLAGALAAAVVASGAAGDPMVLIPVPSRREAIRQRGADRTLALARATAGQLRRAGLAARAQPALRLSRTTQDSAGLDAGRRAVNLAGAMAVRDLRLPAARPPGSQGGIVLVDDLVTTGATLAEAARALAEAGHPTRTAAVIAATERWDSGWDRRATVLASEPYSQHGRRAPFLPAK